MQLSPELLFALAIAAIAFLAGIVYLGMRGKRTRSVGLRVASGPANLRFTCAGCSGQFTHSRRTIAAWNKGTRKFFCNACHTKWHGTRRDPRSAVITKAGRATGEPGKARAGCLGVVILLIAIPAGVAIVALLPA